MKKQAWIFCLAFLLSIWGGGAAAGVGVTSAAGAAGTTSATGTGCATQDQTTMRYILNAEKVFPIKTRLGYISVLEFPCVLDEVYCGDLNAFGIEVVGRRIIIKPFLAGARTNLIAGIGSQKRYVFELNEDSTNIPDYVITMIDPERGFDFRALLETINKGIENDGCFITDINNLYYQETAAGTLKMAFIRLMRDTRKDYSVIWWRIFNTLRPLDERDITVLGYQRIAVITDALTKEEMFSRSYRDYFIVLAGTSLTDRFSICHPWNGEKICIQVSGTAGVHYEPNNLYIPLRKFRVWIDTFVDESTGRTVEVPGHFDYLEIQRFLERGVQ